MVGYLERLVNMKKILMLIIALTITLPAIASCSISGGSGCSYSIIDPPTLQERHLPDNIDILKNSNRLELNPQRPYTSEMLNTETGAASNLQDEEGYNSNCQFGVCLPGMQSADE